MIKELFPQLQAVILLVLIASVQSAAFLDQYPPPPETVTSIPGNGPSATNATIVPKQTGKESAEPFRPFTPRPKDDLNSGLCPFLTAVKWEPEKPISKSESKPDQALGRQERCWNFQPGGNADILGIYNWFTSHWDSTKCYTCYCYVKQN